MVSDARVVLDNLWVTPEQIGKGIGRRACERVFQLAREQGWDIEDGGSAISCSETRQCSVEDPTLVVKAK